MKNYLLKALAYDKQVRIYVVRCDNVLNSLAKRLNYYPSALAAVGRVMAFTTMMGGMLKLEETVTVKVDGDGPIGLIMAEADAHGHVRGYCDNPHCHFEYNDYRLNAKQTIGTTGFISIIKDLKLKEPFIGSTPIISGEIAEDFAYYYQVSEQVPSAVGLGVLVDTENKAVASGGFIIQLLPNTPEEVILKLEEKLKMIPTVSEMLSSGYTPEDIIFNIADDVEIIESVDVEFRCNCSKERVEQAVASIGRKDLVELIEEGKDIEVKCHFCNTAYNYTIEDLTNILKRSRR